MHEAQSSGKRRSGLLWAAAPLAVPLLVVVWWLLRSDPPADVAGAGASAPPASAQPAFGAKARELAHDGVPIKPAGSAISREDEGPMHPHPITPQHERIFNENNLLGSLNGAMDLKDVPELRRLLKRYREEYPEDAHVMQDGYEIIANCLETPGPTTRAVAQRYYDHEIASGLRRYIRRHCLEAQN